MPLVDMDANGILTNRARPRKWPSAAGTGMETLRPVARPYYHPRIKIEKGDQVFAMGSCFARQLEDAGPKWLGLKKVSHFNSRSQNKYNVFSVLNQIKWAHGLDDIRNSYSCILPYSSSTYTDFHGHTLTLEDPDEERDPKLWTTRASEQEMRQSRERVNAIFEQMRDANFLVLTLGMAEVWYDRETGLVLNETPSLYTIERFPNRFGFRQLDFNDVIGALEEIYDIFSARKGDAFKLLLTVSPIPYSSGFSPNGGPIAGNCYSKSVQRAAAETMMARHENVGYFPSYEMAIHSDNRYVWGEDLIHVTDDFAAYILSYALRCLLSDELLEEHPEISQQSIDEHMIGLFKEMGLKEFLKPYLKIDERVRTEVANQKDEWQAETIEERARLSADRSHIMSEAIRIAQSKDQLIEELTRERERLLDEKNALYIEKLKRELGDVDQIPND